LHNLQQEENAGNSLGDVIDFSATIFVKAILRGRSFNHARPNVSNRYIKYMRTPGKYQKKKEHIKKGPQSKGNKDCEGATK